MATLKANKSKKTIATKKGFTNKEVTFCNGSRLTWEISNDNTVENWTFYNASLSNLTYEINFENSTGVTIDSKNDRYSFTTKSFETTTFDVNKEPNANFVFTIELTSEEPLSAQDQFDYITKNTPNLLSIVLNSK